MMGKEQVLSQEQSLSKELIRYTGVDTARCYQCGKCSAGCPLAGEMDFTSSVLMRMLQVEDKETDLDILRSEAIWLCASCEMCISRCPMQVDIPKAMDYLRQRSLAGGLQNKAAGRDIIPFHRSFLDMIHWGGRSYEIGLVADYKMRSKRLFQDLTLAPRMFVRGKLSILPDSVKDKKSIKSIFKRTESK